MSKHEHSQKGSGKQAAKRSSTRKIIQPVSDEERHAMIAEAAYLLAVKRGFQGDAAMDDWLLAETEIDARLRAHE